MVWLLALVLALAVLWAWLAGHWFGRVLMLMALGGFCLATALVNGDSRAFSLLVVALPAVWIIAALPTYYRRHRNRAFMAAPGVDYLVPRAGGGWVSLETWKDRG